MKCYLCGNPIEDDGECASLTSGYAPNPDTQQSFRPRRLLGLICTKCIQPHPDGDYVQEVAEIITVHAVCPKCKNKQKVPDKFKGKGIVCKICNWGYTI